MLARREVVTSRPRLSERRLHPGHPSNSDPNGRRNSTIRSWPRRRDLNIFATARSAVSPVAIVTKDQDFPKLLDRQGPPPQVVWLRCGNVTNRDLRRIVLDAWPQVLALIRAGEPLVEIRSRGQGSS